MIYIAAHKKFNVPQLLRIEEQLGASAVYPGIRAFNVNND